MENRTSAIGYLSAPRKFFQETGRTIYNNCRRDFGVFGCLSCVAYQGRGGNGYCSLYVNDWSWEDFLHVEDLRTSNLGVLDFIKNVGGVVSIG